MSNKKNSSPSPAPYQAPVSTPVTPVTPISAAAPDLSSVVSNAGGTVGLSQIAPPPPEIAKPVTASPTGQIANMPIPMANVEKTQPSKGDVNKPPNPYGGDFRMYDFKK
jgi:hypothetical protein